MTELNAKREITEVQKPESSAFQEIKPQTDMTAADAFSFIGSLFNGSSEISSDPSDIAEKRYVSEEIRYRRTPKESDHVHWDGERGDSICRSTGETPESKAVQEKLAAYGMEGVEYRNAEPDFSRCAEITLTIDHMTENRPSYKDNEGHSQPGNFEQADTRCAELWNASGREGRTNWTAGEVRDWRHDNGYSWHERCDTRTMDLVPRSIHEFFTHSGGCAECKARDSAGLNHGGDFDE